MNKKLNFNELVTKQLQNIQLQNALYQDLLEIGEQEIFFSKDSEEDLKEGYNIEYTQYYLIEPNLYDINAVIENRTLDIIRIDTQRDEYYFLGVKSYGVSWKDIQTAYTEKDIFNY